MIDLASSVIVLPGMAVFVTVVTSCQKEDYLINVIHSCEVRSSVSGSLSPPSVVSAGWALQECGQLYLVGLLGQHYGILLLFDQRKYSTWH